MRYILALDVGEDNPALFGPFTEQVARREGEGMTQRWGMTYEVWPLYSSYGEYIRETGDISD